MELRFVWDKKKNAANIMKHGVSFIEAENVFTDPKCIERHDNKHSFSEDRWMVIGLYGSVVYNVIFTERNGKIRIISARKANKKEIERYFYGNGKTYNRH